MALETYYTFSADTLKAEMMAGKYGKLRYFMYGDMNSDYSFASAPQWATLQNTPGADGDHGSPGDSTFVWHQAADTARLPSLNAATHQHSSFAQLGATCMYFGAELIDAREAQVSRDYWHLGCILSRVPAIVNRASRRSRSGSYNPR